MNEENRTFRLVCSEKNIPAVEKLLRIQGFEFRPLPFDSFARELLHAPFPLGSSLAQLFGRIYIQDRSSMLPPLALAPRSGAGVLDMCSAPGSKTGMLSRLVGPTGYVLACEPSPDRLGILRMNLRRCNAVNVGTLRTMGQEAPLTEDSWEYIQLDPPCSGWGTINRNPKARELWSGEKLAPLVALQKALLAKAATLLAPGGVVLYSTCTTNVQENEEQIRWAMDELGFELEPLTRPESFTFDSPMLSGLDGVLRVADASLGQGFFLARLRKPGGPSSQSCAQNMVSLSNSFPSAAGAQELDIQDIDGGHGLCMEQLPAGVMRDVRGKVEFLPYPLEELAKEGVSVRGFPLGRLRSAGKGASAGKRGSAKKKNMRQSNAKRDIARFSVDPTARVLMPQWCAVEEKCVVEDGAALESLFQGRALVAPSGIQGGVVPLYFESLALGWLTCKGKRLLWPEKSATR